jgi:hypothetical protein
MSSSVLVVEQAVGPFVAGELVRFVDAKEDQTVLVRLGGRECWADAFHFREPSGRADVFDTLTKCEEGYVQLLSSFVQVFADSLDMRDTEVKRELLKDPSIALALSSFRQILSLHAPLIRAMQDAEHSFASHLFDFASGLGCYSEYATHVSTAVNSLTQFASKHKAIVEVLVPFLGPELADSAPGEAREAALAKVSKSERVAAIAQLREYMMLPVSRYERYALVAEMLLVVGEDAKGGAVQLPAACEKLVEAVQLVQAEVVQRQHQQQVLDIQAQFVGSVALFEPQRRLVHEGPLKKASRKKLQQFHFHLFNDALVYSRRTVRGMYRLHRALPLNSLLVEDVDEEDYGLGLDTTSALGAAEASEAGGKRAVGGTLMAQFPFRICSAQKSFMVHAASAEEKQRWLAVLTEEIQMAKKATEGGGGSRGGSRLLAGEEGAGDGDDAVAIAPVWDNDGNASGCPICEKPFSMYSRRHHCRC